MKKIIFFITAVLIFCSFGFAAAGGSKSLKEKENKTQIVKDLQKEERRFLDKYPAITGNKKESPKCPEGLSKLEGICAPIKVLDW